MVAVRLEGRLGNQLFQYAFIYATAKKLNDGFYIDKSIEEFIPARYFNLKPDFLHPLDSTVFSTKGFKNFFSYRLKRAFYALLQTSFFGKNIITVSGDQAPQQALSQVKDGYMYHGFFQSESYFENAKAELSRLFTIKPNLVNAYNAVRQKLPSAQKTIVIHVRRGDYVDLDFSLPVAYYKTALAEADYNNALCVFISDDHEFIMQEFAYIENIYISNHNEIIDLQFLINADVCILSNSSFSWWGAWLNKTQGKVVYAPKNWLNFNAETVYPAGIAANLNFNWIAVNN